MTTISKTNFQRGTLLKTILFLQEQKDLKIEEKITTLNSFQTVM